MESKLSDVNQDHASISGLVNLVLTPTTGGRVRNISVRSYQPSGHYGDSVRKFVGDEMDDFLMSQGLVRRALPGRLDETLFRAVSEAVHHSQTASEVKTVEECLRQHLEMRRKSRRIAYGSLEPGDPFDLVKAASDFYRLTIVMYHLPHHPPVMVTHESSVDEGSPVLYLYDMGHKYDYVYPREQHEALALAQGIVYSDLYRKVFRFKKTDIADIIKRVRCDAGASGEVSAEELNRSMTDEASMVCRSPLPTGRPVIPYSAAKSIDPSIYRNVPFDIANKALKIRKKNGVTCHHMKFPPESLCLAKRGDRFEYAKVVELFPNGVRLVRFLDNTQLRVKTTDLRGRGTLYPHPLQYGGEHRDVSGNSPLPTFDCSVPPPPIPGNIVPFSYTSAGSPQTVTASALMPETATSFSLPPTYYVGQHHVRNNNSIQQYLSPESPQCTWWNKKIESNSPGWAYPNQSANAESSYASSRSGNSTNPWSNVSDSLVSDETVSPLSDFTDTRDVLYINQEQYSLVDRTANLSLNENGGDLHAEHSTLRFFFNLDVATHYNNAPDDNSRVLGRSNIAEFTSGGAPPVEESMPTPWYIPVPRFNNPMCAGSQQYLPPTPLLQPPAFHLSQLSPVCPANSPMPYVNNDNGPLFFP